MKYFIHQQVKETFRGRTKNWSNTNETPYNTEAETLQAIEDEKQYLTKLYEKSSEEYQSKLEQFVMDQTTDDSSPIEPIQRQTIYSVVPGYVIDSNYYSINEARELMQLCEIYLLNEDRSQRIEFLNNLISEIKTDLENAKN